MKMRMPISFGNLKLPKTTAIFCMTGAYYGTCPSDRLGLCKHTKICYARRMEERCYATLIPFRERQTKYWDSVTAQEFVDDLMAIVRRRRTETTALRVSESGDFRTQADFDKVNEIAEILKGHGIKVYCYTARSDLDLSNRSENFVISGSGFMVDNNFYIVGKNEKVDGPVCPADCKICTMCQQKKQRNIAVRQH